MKVLPKNELEDMIKKTKDKNNSISKTKSFSNSLSIKPNSEITKENIEKKLEEDEFKEILMNSMDFFNSRATS